MTEDHTARDAHEAAADDAALRAAIRAGLGATEPARTPSFAAVWQRAEAHANARPARHGAAAGPRWTYAIAAGIAAVALSAVLGWQRIAGTPALVATAQLADQTEVTADLQLALALAAREPLRVPTDALLNSTPVPMTHGAPSLPAVSYPLLPEEKYL
jgi:hypothetical protein